MSGARKVWQAAVIPGLAVAAALVVAGCQGAATQGWTQDYRQGAWYNGTQGSRLMPLTWLQALEQPGFAAPAGAMFMDNAYLASFRILCRPTRTPRSPCRSVSRSTRATIPRSRRPSCAGTPGNRPAATGSGSTARPATPPRSTTRARACVSTAPPASSTSRASWRAWTRRWSRPAIQRCARRGRRALGPVRETGAGREGPSPASRTLLLQALNKLIDWEKRTETLNHTDLRYGYGRVDAVGHIFNRILLFGGAPQPLPNASDAPVSYPHLWDITKEHQVQWDGIATNAKLDAHLNPFTPNIPFDFGAMGRNSGEVLGVFGEVVIKPPTSTFQGFASSVNEVNLNRMEIELAQLDAAGLAGGDVRPAGRDRRF